MYVTEYEDAYKWPTPFVYRSPDRHRRKLGIIINIKLVIYMKKL